MKKNLIYILGIIVALLILFSEWSGELNAIESGSSEVLMFNNNVPERYSVMTGYRFAKQDKIQQQTASKNNINYLAIEYVPGRERDWV